MFVVKCTDTAALLEALFLLSLYRVRFEAQSDGEDAATTILVVDKELREGDLRLAEMAFQMQFPQTSSMACPVCYGQGESVCGHLVFTTSL